MSARNLFHDAVVDALVADGWTITDDPLTISIGNKDLFVDLGAERGTIGAEKEGEQIAVEIQSFLNPSPIRDLQEAVGQYAVYRAIMEESDPDRRLYLAVPRRVWKGVLAEPIGQLILKKMGIRVLVFHEKKRKVVEWKN